MPGILFPNPLKHLGVSLKAWKAFLKNLLEALERLMKGPSKISAGSSKYVLTIS
jgi:hypothetical protein